MEAKPFDNAERNRYYGIRVGDMVVDSFMTHIVGEVVEYDPLDNNAVYVKIENGNIVRTCPETLCIETKVEHRK